ncbi:FKBP-type peptidyl-prolyl cis-trans isomerase [Tenacibaculum sp. M341]|uniref:FKBP-type peptidyl-prolyl cis-trans isomerase n=1 Tax=Tenacibaculum sp. M341 TaxID=2530339 RepID=UPI001046A2BE|nr:FKBP-type peptidyl-prolyl cis-trans isomerase [Tenacibaculum sp. M341]TCI85117.1 FKBP-type peptidyl-prolyl cis-trans isomerase [Tenacibaculum sp. M341]
MKINKFLAVAVLGVSAVACNNGGTGLTKKKSLETNIDSVSYAVGLSTGMRMKSDPIAKDLDLDVYLQGFMNGVDSTEFLLDPSKTEGIMRAYFQKKQAEIMKQREEEAKKKTEKEYGDYKKENEKFLVDNKTKSGIITTESGLQYQVIKEGNGESPKATDRVKVHYHGTVIDGTVFDSSVDRGTPSEFGVNQVIKGWIEGLQLMKPGAKYKFFIPQELAYGYQGRLPKIKPFSTLIFDVELIEIKEAANTNGHSAGDGHGH